MPVSLVPILPHIPVFLLVVFRLAGIFMFAPMFGSDIIPVKVKALLALVLGFCVYPLIPPQAPVHLTMMSMVVSIGSEMLIGLVIGYGASLPLVAMQLGGLIMGQQLGLGFAQVLNPDFGEDTDVLGQTLFVTALTVFIVLNGHHILLSTLVHSFSTVPIGAYMPGSSVLHVITGLLASMFELGVRVAAPLLCLVFLETIAMGFIARTVPQLNILSLGFPLRIIIGMMLVIALIGPIYESLIVSMRHALGLVYQLFGG
ncbi:MAG: flagellar biosynthetic protein FliR [Planctomycetes bacterium]|nr:flagellar biosynthetic protein FliR [Planctomycetota bacterium]